MKACHFALFIISVARYSGPPGVRLECFFKLAELASHGRAEGASQGVQKGPKL